MTQEEEREITNRYVAGLTPEQAFEFFKLNRQIAADARADYAKSSAALMLAHGDKMKEYGQNATRGLFLLNGGSIIALMTLIGSSIGKTVAGYQLHRLCSSQPSHDLP